jgi:hypothetical protein
MLLLVNTNTVHVEKVALTLHLEQLVDSVKPSLKSIPISPDIFSGRYSHHGHKSVDKDTEYPGTHHYELHDRYFNLVGDGGRGEGRGGHEAFVTGLINLPGLYRKMKV